MDRLVIASNNPGKLRELGALFEPLGVAVVPQSELGVAEADEPHETFLENALAKARYFHALTGRPAVADDSGLEVAALDGQPGVRSKRWSGRVDLAGQALDDANNALLLERLREVDRPPARYVCAAAYCDGVREEVTLGDTAGIIVLDARGTAGFGYDPYFLSDELGATFGESSRESKERVSHRGRAFRALLERLRRS